MDNNKIGHHIYEQFNRELEQIRQQVLTMCGLVEQQLDLGMGAFGLGDLKQAEQGIKLINQVYAIKQSLDNECIQLLALRQPIAFDLRFLITVIKIISELEMMGDLAVTIAKMAIQLSNFAHTYDNYPELQHLSVSVKELLHTASDAFAGIKVNDMTPIDNLSKTVSHEYANISRQLTSKMMKDPKNISHTLDVLRIARALERIGDHVFHICEELIYMENGETIRHLKCDSPV